MIPILLSRFQIASFPTIFVRRSYTPLNLEFRRFFAEPALLLHYDADQFRKQFRVTRTLPDPGSLCLGVLSAPYVLNRTRRIDSHCTPVLNLHHPLEAVEQDPPEHEHDDGDWGGRKSRMQPSLLRKRMHCEAQEASLLQNELQEQALNVSSNSSWVVGILNSSWMSCADGELHVIKSGTSTTRKIVPYYTSPPRNRNWGTARRRAPRGCGRHLGSKFAIIMTRILSGQAAESVSVISF